MFQNPLGLLALLAVPAVLALHLWRRRFRPHTVSAVFLWQLAGAVPAAGRRRERLLRTPSLWLELLAAACLALALAGPRGCAAGEARHLVAVLDGSASMGAVAGGDRAVDRAARELAARIDRLPRRSRVTLVATGPRPAVLAGPAAWPDEARAALARFDPRAPRHDAQPALALAAQIAGEGSVLYLTDRYEPEAHPAAVDLVAVGRPADNVGFVHAVRAPADGGDVVLATVRSFARAARTVELELVAEGAVAARVVLDLEPGARRAVELPIPTGTGAVELRLEPDALAVDDRAYLAPTPPRTLALASDLDAATATRLGLGADGGLERWLALVPASVAAPSPELAHIALSAGEVGGPGTWRLEVGAPGDARRDLVGPFLVEKRHPLCDGLTLDGVVWSVDPDRPLLGAPLVSAGDQPILTEEADARRRVWRLNLDPARSTLARSPDWPILLANAAELRRAELPGPERANLAVGEPLVWRGDGDATYRLVGPGTDESLRARRTLVVEGLDAPGVYALEQAGPDGPRALGTYGLTFLDAAESDLAGLGSGRRPADVGATGLASESGWVESLFALAALACALCDWWWLARRTGGGA